MKAVLRVSLFDSAAGISDKRRERREGKNRGAIVKCKILTSPSRT